MILKHLSSHGNYSQMKFVSQQKRDFIFSRPLKKTHFKNSMTLASQMKRDGHAVSLICGTQVTGPERIDHATRDKVMKEFRDGVTKVLIATDVLARGIDVAAVTLVVNYEIPTQWVQGQRADEREVDGETYLHRVGRTGRFGMKGVAISLLDQRERKLFFEIRDRYR